MKHKKSLKAIQRIVTHHSQKKNGNKRPSLGVLGMLHLSYILFLSRLVTGAKSVAVANGKCYITADDFYEISEAVLKESAG